MKRQPKIGQRLAAARLKRGHSQATVARRAGIAASSLSRIETGKVQPTYRTLLRIARAIGTPFDELAEFDPAQHRGAGGCPISEQGQCLLDLIDTGAEAEQIHGGELYSPRQVDLLRRFALWLRTASPERQRAMRIWIDDR